MNFCSHCGSNRMTHTVPDNDNRKRWVCEDCGRIFYENPNVIVGTLPIWEQKVLLCRRAIQPRLGFWTLPAGFLEHGETVADGAVRETMEESGAEIRIRCLHTIYNVSQMGQIYMIYLADIVAVTGDATSDFPFGPETSEVMLAAPDEIPWEEIAFSSVKYTLEKWVEQVDESQLPFEAVHPDAFS